MVGGQETKFHFILVPKLAMVVDYGRWVKGSEWAPASAPIWMDGDWMSKKIHLILFLCYPPWLA
jgi:hypothetical protein